MITDGVYIIIKLALVSYLGWRARRRAAAAAAAQLDAAAAAAAAARPGASELLADGDKVFEDSDKDMGDDDDDGGHHVVAGESEFERTLRRHVFQSGAIPWCEACRGRAGLGGAELG